VIQNKRFAFTYRLCAFVFATVGLLKQIGVFEARISFRSFMFYTIQSNLLAVILFAFLAIRTGISLREGLHGSSGWYSRLGMVCAVDLLVTLLVFWALLVQEVPPDYLWSFDNIAVHAVTPLLCLLDYILFSEPRRLKYQDVYLVCIYPLCYVIFTSIAGLAGYVYYYTGAFSGTFSNTAQGVSDTILVRFPYYFLDFDRLGIVAAAYTGAILILFLILAHVIYIVDRKVRTTKRSNTSRGKG